MKAQIGDSVKIIANNSYHKFKIGEIVKIIDVQGEDYTAKSATEDCFWWIGEDEFELIESKHD